MVFVYRGAGKRQREDADVCQKNRRCQKLACDIQYCLSRSNYQQERCRSYIDDWNSCCDAAKAKELKESMDAISSSSSPTTRATK